MVKTRVSYEANPNGNLWLKDNSGFGQKMLAKMGWKEGQGLGRTEQGITAAIRVSRKRDNRGVGCSRQWAEEGSAQMDAFSAVLADLNRHQESSGRSEGDNDADQPIGLEESSRRSRNRLHYAKFTRGKDLSRCSEQALLSIMGPRGVQQLNEKKEEKEEPKVEDAGLRHVHSSLSTAEYFAQKMEAMRARLKASASAPVLCDNRDEEEEEGEMKEEGEGSGLFSPRPTFQLGGDVSDQLEEGELSQHSIPTSPVPAAFETAVAENEKLEKKRRKVMRIKRRRERENEEVEDAEKNEEESKTDDRREERRRRKEERRKRRRERENEEVEDCILEDAEKIEEESKTDDRREERRRRKEERRRRRHERYSAAQTEKEEEEEEADDDDLPKLDNVVSEKEENIDSSVPNNEENVSKKKRKKKNRKHRTQSSESEEESVSKKPKIRPTSAPMTDEEAASFAFENQEIMQHLEWSAFSTSNLGLVVGYKYASVLKA